MKIIKQFKERILNLLKSLFSKKQPEKKKEHFHHEYPKYLQLIKQDKPIVCSKGIQDLFDSIYQGDIVLAHMPLSEDKLQQIPEGHRIRPYYIAYKLENGFIAYSSSSSPFDWLTDDKTYSLSDFSYEDLDKSSYFNLYYPYYLPKDKIIKFICETKENDFNEIQRRLWINRREEYESLFKELPAIHNPIPGDIINSQNNQWVVIAELKDSYVVYEVSKNNKKHFSKGIFVHCNQSLWKVNLTKEWIINKKEGIRTQHIVNRDDFINLKKLANKTKGSWSNIPKGTIFSKNGHLFYCYSSNGNSINAYNVRKTISQEELLKYKVIEVNDDTYYVNTKTSVLVSDFADVSDVIQVSCKYISLIDENHKKELTKNNKPKYYTKFKIGTIFKDIYENEEYVYIYSNRSYDYFIKVSEYLNSEVYPKYPLYEMYAKELQQVGEANDDEICQILSDQISYGNDKCLILSNKLKEIDDQNV